jgi:hypothetical protein
VPPSVCWDLLGVRVGDWVLTTCVQGTVIYVDYVDLDLDLAEGDGDGDSRWIRTAFRLTNRYCHEPWTWTFYFVFLWLGS